MTKPRKKYDEDFKKNAVKLSYASPESVPEIAEDLGVNPNILYRWRQRYTSDRDKTKYATLEEELRETQRELAEIKMERDMLKKQRPTSRVCTSEVQVYTGTPGISCNEVLGDYLADRMTKELTINVFSSVTARHELGDGCVFRSDRGSQYTSKAFMEILKNHGIRQSFSRVGMPVVNAWSESFFAAMKKELIHGAHFDPKAEVREAVFEYIYGFYNVTRIQKKFGYLSPREFFRSLDQERLLVVA